MADPISTDLCLKLEVDSVATVNFAMHQNDVPLVRHIKITNLGQTQVENLRLRVACEPELFPAWETSVASVPPGGAHSLRSIDLRLSPGLLAGLAERVNGSLHAEIRIGEEVVCRETRPMAMLAFDEWNGLAYAMPELLAAFVLPNHASVEQLLSEAAEWLGEKTGDRALSGYQSRNAARVSQVVQAIYMAVQARGLSYCSPPASFESTGQKIRLPDRVFEHKLATCLDLAVLFAACLEQAGLNPLVGLSEDHAFAGAWLVEECFPDPGTDDVLRLRKRVDLNEILVFEPTLTTAPPPNDFASAVLAGKRHLTETDTFRCAIDIGRCRKSGIRPLPNRGQGSLVVEASSGTGADLDGAVFELPEVATPKPASEPETPATRLDRWKRKLLDLSLHNRLINFKESKKTVPLLCPDLATLEDALADGLEFKVLARPSEFGPDAARSTELHRLRTGEDALDRLLSSELASRRLRAGLSEQDLRTRLTEMFRTARTSMEEGGASALYLALGFLAWYEADSASQQRLAPIILIPVELRRNSVQEGFRFCQSDEDPRINITLLEMLAKDFELRVPNMDPILEDDHGIDVNGILTAFRLAIKNTNRWDVVETAQLGFFSFTKFLMWRDLEKRTEDLLRNKVVNHLVNHAYEPFPDDGVFPDEERLDDQYSPNETFCPLPCDSSQLAAIHAAAAPKTFVMFGPPGTGKSQTITNLIAHSLANNKSVLFVSEKMAALNVVYNRLSQCGLSAFCLELHSNKANKRHVVDQLGRALDFRAKRSMHDWEREASRLAGLRAELNAFVRALHQPRGTGESAFCGLSRLIGLRKARCLDLGFTDHDAITRERVEQWREMVEQLRTVGEACGHPGSTAWTGSTIQNWSAVTQRAVESDVTRLRELCDHLAAHAQTLGPPLGLGTAWTVSYYGFAAKFVSFLARSPRPTAAMLTTTDWGVANAYVNTWVKRGRQRDELRRIFGERYDDSVLALGLDDLADQVTKARARWFLPRWLATRGIRRVLRGSARRRETLGLEELARDVATARALRDENRWLSDAGAQARVLLGEHWNAGEADWDAIEAIRDWSSEFRKFADSATGGNVDAASILRNHWTRLVTDNHEWLQPNGALGVAFTSFLESFSEFVTIKTRLEGHLGGGDALWGATGRQMTTNSLAARLDAWKAGLGQLRAWCNWRRMRGQAERAGLLPLVAAYETGAVPNADFRDTFDRSFYQWWTESVIETDATLREFFSPEHERKIRQFKELDERLTDLTKAEIQARLSIRRPSGTDRVSSNSETGILNRQRQLRRGHMPVRQLFRKIPGLLHQLKPCVLMSPISVAQYLDPSHPPFDLVVFDEASQVPVWDAVGAIARGAEVVIAGDPKQLPPTTFFMRSDEQDPGDEALTDVQDMESILDDCMAARLPTMPLRWHYRSRHESLIAFSNYFYYDNELLTFPSPFAGKGVSFRHVPEGVYDRSRSRTNRAEAEAVVAEVVGRLRGLEQPRRSIGVVTFSIAQQGLVEDLLDEARRVHPEIEPYFGDDVLEPVFVKNLENVQGDERDVILMSVCYGPDAQGRVSMNFGPLNRDGGERRLNVAITRARHEVVVLATLKAEQIDLSRTRARGVEHLKYFLDYAVRGRDAIAQALTLRGGDDFDSPFEKAVCDTLRERGHEVHSQVGCSGYRIDLAIVDPKAPGRYLLGIECDGANYHSGKTARDRDRLREYVLVGLGWRLHRIWSSDWWQDPDECLTSVEAALDQARAARSVSAAQPATNNVSDMRPATACDPVESSAEPDAEPRPAADGAPPVYRAYRARRLFGARQEFYDPAASKAIQQLVETIVVEEGPVSLEVLSRRVAERWGFARVGATIRDRIARVVRRSDVQLVQQDHGTFLWPRNVNPNEYRTFRVPGIGEDEQRGIDEIPLEELIAAVLYVLREQISLPRDDLVRETGLLLGFRRTGATIQRIVEHAIDRAIETGEVKVEEDARMRLGC